MNTPSRAICSRTTIQVTTYNVQSFPSVLTALFPILPNGKKCAKAIFASDPFRAGLNDFLVFTESFSSSTTRNLHEQLKARGYYMSERPYSPLWLNGGVFICSRTPLMKTTTVVFDDGFGTDFFAAKGFVYVVTIMNGTRVGLIGTHLQSGECARRQKVRSAQIQQLRKFLDKELRESPIDVVIVAGDLNVDFHSPEFEYMIAGLRAEPFDLMTPWLKSRDPVTNSILRQQDPQALREQLDYVLVLKSESGTARVKNTTCTVQHLDLDISDHHAVVGVVDF